jgi:hypothetical protein
MQLSPQRSFVVQLPDESQVFGRRMTGRVEHVASHQTAQFDSLEALLAFRAHVLGEAEVLEREANA